MSLVWLVALSRLKLTYAGAVVGATYYLLVGLSSWLLLGETVGPQRAIGLAAIGIGVLLVDLS